MLGWGGTLRDLMGQFMEIGGLLFSVLYMRLI